MLTLLRMQVPSAHPTSGCHHPSTAHGESTPPYPIRTHRNLEETGPTLSSRLPCAQVWFSSICWALGWLPLPTSCGAPILRVADLSGQPGLHLLEQRAR